MDNNNPDKKSAANNNIVNDVTPPVTPDKDGPETDEPAVSVAVAGQTIEPGSTSSGKDDSASFSVPVSIGSSKSSDTTSPKPAEPSKAREVPATDRPETDPLQTASQQPATDANPVQAVSPRKKTGKRVLVLALVALLLIGGGAAYYFLGRKSDDKKPAVATTTSGKKDIPNIRYVTTNSGWDAFYPANDDSSNYLESNVMIFEGLVRFENKTQIVPLLATGWTNPDSSTWVFNLRKDVTFHSGRNMTAEDVKLSFDAARDSDIGQISADTIKSIAVTGPYQVTIKTDGPDATFLRKMTNYYVYDTKSGKTADPVNGTGPFTVKSGTTPKETSLELVAYDKYYGGRPHVRSFSFVGLDDFDHGKAYGDGQANLMSTFADNFTALNNKPHSSLPLDQSSVFLMPFNTKKPNSPLAKLPVRQAIELALDPAAIAKVRNTNAVPASQLVPSSIPGYDSSIKRPARDVTKAKQLLKDAGYPNGTTFTLSFYQPSQTTAAEIAKELAEAGIKVTLDPQPTPKAMGEKSVSPTVDAFFSTYTSDIFDGSDVLKNYATTPIYQNQSIVDLVTKANATLDASQHVSYLKEASGLMSKDIGVEPIFVQSGDEIIYNPSFVISRDIANNSLGIYFQKVYAK